MGEYVFTCSVSNLPIQQREPVRFILLKEYPPAHLARRDGGVRKWGLRWLPLRAKYDGRGSVTNVEDTFLVDTFLQTLPDDIKEKPRGTEYPDREVPIHPGMAWGGPDGFLDALWEYRVEDTQGCLVRSAMVREDVWQALLRLEQPYCPYSYEWRQKGLSFPDAASYLAATETAWTRIQRECRLHRCAVQDLLAVGASTSNIRNSLAEGRFRDGVASDVHYTPESPVDTYFVAGAWSTTQQTERLADHMVGLILAQQRGCLTDEQVAQVQRVLAETFFVGDLLEAMRVPWRPLFSTGWTDQPWRLHRDFYAAMGGVAGAHIAEHLAEDD